MNPILSKVSLGSRPGGRPPAAVEISPQGVLAAALPATGQKPVFAYAPLPEGAVLPGIGEPNIRTPDAVTAALRTVFGQVSPRSHAVTLILPDTVVRVFVLDFDALPAKTDEALSVLRFRLRKMVPFEIEPAGISYQMLVQNKTDCKVLAAVIPGSVLQEYEAAIRSAGYEPGAVLPSGLAALDVLNSMEAVLIASLTPLSLTTSIINGQDLLLYRTLDLPQDPEQRLAEVQRGIGVAAAYYEDKLQMKPRRLYFTGSGETFDIGSWIDDPDFSVVDLAPRPETGLTTAMGDISYAGVTGALAGVS